MKRAIRRQMAKEFCGTSRIHNYWMNMQIKRMGFRNWLNNLIVCNPKHHIHRI